MVRRSVSGLLFLLTATAAAVAVPVAAYAADPQMIEAANSLPVIVDNITTWIIGLLLGVATLFLTIGGLRYLAAGGDPAEVEKAKSALKSALIGHALAILAPVLLTVVRGWIGGPRRRRAAPPDPSEGTARDRPLCCFSGDRAGARGPYGPRVWLADRAAGPRLPGAGARRRRRPPTRLLKARRGERDA